MPRVPFRMQSHLHLRQRNSIFYYVLGTRIASCVLAWSLPLAILLSEDLNKTERRSDPNNTVALGVTAGLAVVSWFEAVSSWAPVVVTAFVAVVVCAFWMATIYTAYQLSRPDYYPLCAVGFAFRIVTLFFEVVCFVLLYKKRQLLRQATGDVGVEVTEREGLSQRDARASETPTPNGLRMFNPNYSHAYASQPHQPQVPETAVLARARDSPPYTL